MSLANNADNELKFWLGQMNKAANFAEVKNVNSLLKEKAGDRKLGYVNLMDVIADCLKNNPAILPKILENMQLTFDNPIVQNSIIDYLTNSGESKELAVKQLQSLNIVPPSYLTYTPLPEPIKVSASLDLGIIDLLVNALKYKEKSQEEKKSNIEQQPFLLLDLLKELPFICDLLKKEEDLEIKNEVEPVEIKQGETVLAIASRIDESGKEVAKVTQEGLLNALFMKNDISNIIFNSESLALVKESVKNANKKIEENFNLKSDSIAEVRDSFSDPKSKVAVTIANRRAEMAYDLVEKHGEKGVEALKALGVDQKQTLHAELSKMLESRSNLPKSHAGEENLNDIKKSSLEVKKGDDLQFEDRLEISRQNALKRAEERIKKEGISLGGRVEIENNKDSFNSGSWVESVHGHKPSDERSR